jgi:hypothetical protein
MAMPTQHAGWTAEMARALPDDGRRYEVLDGALLVTPAPELVHQRAVMRLYDHLKNRTEAAGKPMRLYVGDGYFERVK